MPVINEFTHPYGLGGGVYLSGSANAPAGCYYAYYPITASVANIKMNSVTNGAVVTASFLAGIPIYGHITSVTQSSGISFVYAADISLGDQ